MNYLQNRVLQTKDFLDFCESSDRINHFENKIFSFKNNVDEYKYSRILTDDRVSMGEKRLNSRLYKKHSLSFYYNLEMYILMKNYKCLQDLLGLAIKILRWNYNIRIQISKKHALEEKENRAQYAGLF